MPAKTTFQINTWTSDFGRTYTDKNARTVEAMSQAFKELLGISRLELNQCFLGHLDRKLRILEVGCNVGVQLQALQQMGFSELYGIEIQSYAVEMSKEKTRGIQIIQGSGLDIPFKDGFFDLVYTSGVLIHVAPDEVKTVMSEMHRCASRFIWGYEYWAPEWTALEYKSRQNLMWKTDYPRLFLEYFSDLRVVKEEKYQYIGGHEVDVMYLLEKMK
ncbi:MAG: pseudaminic acid biosynthesis-associated methylase [Thermodesulfobacteriota bacterium]